VSLIIGLGTGRCGSVSLSKILSSQEDSYFTHEFGAIPRRWSRVTEFEKEFEKHIQSGKSFFGDVASYNLELSKHYLKSGIDLKAIILKRERSEVIRSFCSKAKDRNHWMDHDGNWWSHDDWDKCFPKFDATSREEAIGLYYDHYYNECEKLDQTKCFWMETPELNDEGKVIEMLSWCGFEDPIFRKFHKNRT
jgi:hypothetical protein